MDKVQKIREEVEKLKLCTMDEHMKFYSDAAESEYNALCNIEHFIDSLQEEPVSKDLEEEIEEYWKNAPTGTVYFPMWEHFQIIARHFAEWQRQKDQKWIDDNRQQIFNEGYKNGSYAGRYDMYNKLFEAAATDRVVTHFLLAHSV